MKKYLYLLRQRSAFTYIVIALLVAHLLPLWAFKYFPSQDGASHLYNAYLLKEYNNPAMYKVRECFELNLTLFPNWFSHAFMAGLMFLVPPLIAEKILLSLCIALAPISLFYFLRAIAGGNAKTPFGSGNQALGLLGFLFAYNYLLHMGFYNFAISVPLFFFILGYWWRHQESMSPANIGVFYALMILLYFCHISSYGLMLMTLSVCALRLIVTPRKLLIFGRLYASGGIYHGQLFAQGRLGQTVSILECRAIMGLFSEDKVARILQREPYLGELRASRTHWGIFLVDFVEGQNSTETMDGQTRCVPDSFYRFRNCVFQSATVDR